MAKINNKKIAVNSLLNTVKTILGLIFPLITFPYVSRVLGVDTLGVYNFSASVISYFLLIAALGISTYGIREGTQYRHNKEQINKFVSEIFSINMISTFVAYALLIICLIFIEKLGNYSVAILLLSIEIISTTIGVAWVCNIYEDFFFITIRTLAIQIISFVLTLIFVKSPADLYKYIAIIVLANSGNNLLNFFYIRRRYCKFKFSLNIDWKRHLRPIMIIFATSVAITIYVSADTTMLGFMTSDYHVGLYGTSVKIYTILKNAISALLVVMIPQFSLIFSQGENEEASRFFSKIFSILTVLVLPMMVGLFMLSEDAVILISGKEFLKASEPLRLLSIAGLLSLYAYMYTQCILIPNKKESIVFLATSVSALVNILLNFLLIPLWGINAAAITTIVAEAIVCGASFVAGREFVRLIKIKRNVITSIIGCACVIAVCLLLKRIESFYIRVGASIISSVIVYFVTLFVLKNNTVFELAEIIGHRFVNKKK